LGYQLTVRLPGLVACASVLWVNVKVPVVVDVPVMEMGGADDRVRPGGSAPEVTVALKGPTPPETKRFWWK
jgi:hypothetical protein